MREGLVVVLDTELNDELRAEGDARELQRAVQDLRKEAGLELDDRIELWVDGLSPAASVYLPSVLDEVLAEAGDGAAPKDVASAIANATQTEVSPTTSAPLIRIGFPIFDRHHHHRAPVWGYQGSLNVLVKILDKIFDEMDKSTNVSGKTDISFDIIR